MGPEWGKNRLGKEWSNTESSESYTSCRTEWESLREWHSLQEDNQGSRNWLKVARLACSRDKGEQYVHMTKGPWLGLTPPGGTSWAARSRSSSN